MLDIPGPTFLLVYAVLAAVTCLYVRQRIAQQERQPASRILRVRDPYEIAYLRGGAGELIQVAVLALIRRGLLEPAADTLHAKSTGASELVSIPIEKAILSACRSATRGAMLNQNASIQAAARAFRRPMTDSNLMPTEQMQRARNSVAAVAAVALILVAMAKMAYATAHGHRNVGLLFVLMWVALFALFKVASASRTQAGDEALRHLGTLFSRVRRGPRPTAPDQLHEALLLAAVYGDYAVPDGVKIKWRKLFQKPSDNSGSGSCGGGNGCGGGGCGGGCGGCGG